jgi:hypothetical protein
MQKGIKKSCANMGRSQRKNDGDLSKFRVCLFDQLPLETTEDDYRTICGCRPTSTRHA